MDYFIYYGINTELFQSGVQLSGMTTFSLPWKVGLKKNVKEKTYEVTFPPCKNTTTFFKTKYVFQDVLLQAQTVALEQCWDLNSQPCSQCHKSLTIASLS